MHRIYNLVQNITEIKFYAAKYFAIAYEQQL